MKKSKEAYYNKHFETNWRNIKNLWKRIKSQISLKTVFSSVPIVFSLGNGDPITNPYDIDIANTFNNYFASIAETMKKTIYIYIFQINSVQTILGIKMVAQYFCNLLIKKNN